MSRLRFVLSLAPLLALVPLAGCPVDPPADTASSGPTQAPEVVWTCSMDPQVREDAPGACPICGMDLVPVRVGADGPTQVTVSEGIRQATGIRLEPVRRQTLFRHLHAPAQIEVAEDRQVVVQPRVQGFVTELSVRETFAPVRRGQVLFTVFSPELVEAQEELLLSRGQGARARAARARLQRLGLARTDIDRVLSAGQALDDIPIRSPMDGVVLELGVTEGGRLGPGPAMRIGDLSRVWVTAEVYEDDAPWLAVGQRAELELSHDPGARLETTVAFLDPVLDPMRRTLSVRMTLDDPPEAWRPGALVTARLGFRRQDDVLAIPRQAVLETGERSVVFVHLGEGRFEPREVTVGLVGDRGMVQIRSGLSEGDEVVANGLFLLDAETQLQDALRRMASAAPDPTAEEALVDTPHTCPMHPEVRQEGPGRCPECGMDLVPVEEAADDAPQGEDHDHDHDAESSP